MHRLSIRQDREYQIVSGITPYPYTGSVTVNECIATRTMENIYKIETTSASSSIMVESFIISMGGKCVRRGSAVITDFSFASASSLQLLPHISTINDQLTDSDFHSWGSLGEAVGAH